MPSKKRSRAKSQARAISVARKRTKSNPCGPGRILRKSSSRKSYSRMSRGRKVTVKRSSVKATCITDRGKPGYGAKLIPPLKRGLLGQFGYSTASTKESRAKALEKAVKKLGKQEVYRHTRALATLQRWNEKAHKALMIDVNMLRKKYYPSRLKKYSTVGK